jgi:cytochrome c oxidase subunit IV
MAGHGHVAPTRMYYAVFGALIVGTIVTVLAAKVDLGLFNNVVMLLIACTKATLVILFFMHVRWSSRLTWVVAAAGFFWLLLLFSVIGDYMSRGWVPGTLR